MKMGDYRLSKEVAHCRMCMKNTETVELALGESKINLCDSCLDNIKEVL